MASPPDTLSGLARILSSEPFPLKPMFRGMKPDRVPAEMEKWTQNLEIWLKKLVGKFTATNIITTIGQGGTGIGFARVVSKSFHYKGTDDATLVIDNGYDWRKSYSFLAGIQASETSAAAVISGPDVNYTRVANNSGAIVFTTPFTTDASWNTISGIGSPAFVIENDGSLTIKANSTGVHREYWVTFTLMAITGVPVGSSFVSAGNGS
jgi:hypothetical protein